MQDINKEMWEVTADYANLNVDGNASNRGGFYLQNANSSDQDDIARINGLLALDATHTDGAYGVMFLLPVVADSKGPIVGDDGNYYSILFGVQPFVAPVPEPGTLLMLGSGLLGLLTHRRLRRPKSPRG
jgi:hypothetical protein